MSILCRSHFADLVAVITRPICMIFVIVTCKFEKENQRAIANIPEKKKEKGDMESNKRKAEENGASVERGAKAARKMIVHVFRSKFRELMEKKRKEETKSMELFMEANRKEEKILILGTLKLFEEAMMALNPINDEVPLEFVMPWLGRVTNTESSKNCFSQFEELEEAGKEFQNGATSHGAPFSPFGRLHSAGKEIQSYATFEKVEATQRSLEEAHQFLKIVAEPQKQKPAGANPGRPVAAEDSEVGGFNQPVYVIPYNSMGNGFVHRGLGINQGLNHAALPAHQGLGHHGLEDLLFSGLAGDPNLGGIPGGHQVNPFLMGPVLSLHGASNPLLSKLGMGAYGGQEGGLGPFGDTLVGGYGGSQGGGGYDAMGSGPVYGGPPTAAGPAKSGGFPDGGHYSLSGAFPAPRVPGAGISSGL